MDYQLAFDPFRDPDLFDAFDEPSQRPPAPHDYALNDGMLDFVVEGVSTEVASKLELPRRSLSMMVNLALERGYALSIGDLIDQVAAFRQYKPFNGLLAVLQRPHPKLLLTAEEWADKWRRRIRPGENPLVLLVPHGPVMFLFDVSQTEHVDGARPLPPELENPFAMKDVLEASYAFTALVEQAKRDGVRVTLAGEGWTRAGCIKRVRSDISQLVPNAKRGAPPEQVPVRWEVRINDALNATERLATLAHELGHLYCGHVGADREDRWPVRKLAKEVREFEAESVCLMVFRRIAPEAAVPPYLDQFFKSGDPLPDQGWDLVVRAAGRVIDMCQPRTAQQRHR